jgi:hypothetical protein
MSASDLTGDTVFVQKAEGIFTVPYVCSVTLFSLVVSQSWLTA